MSTISKWVCLCLLYVISLASVACTTPQVYDKAVVEIFYLPDHKNVDPAQTITLTDAKSIRQLADHFDLSAEPLNWQGLWEREIRVTFTNHKGSRIVTTNYEYWNDSATSDWNVKDKAGLETLILSIARKPMQSQSSADAVLHAAASKPE